MKCPTCGNEMTPFGSMSSNPPEYYLGQIAQHQNLNQLAGYGMQNGMQNGYSAQAMSGGSGRTFGNPACDEPETPRPEPKQTAWSQFKKAIREVFP